MGKKRGDDIIKNKTGTKNTPQSFRPEVVTHIEEQIKRLQLAFLAVDGWKAIVDKFDEDDQFSSYFVYDIRLKAYYLSKLYKMSL